MKNDTKFRGQWTGTSETGSYCVTNLDQQGDAVTGRVALFETIVIDDQPFAFWTWSFLSGTVARNGRLTGEISIPSVHFRSGELLNDDQLSELLNKGGLELPTATKFSTTAASNYQLESSWTSQYPTHPKRSENVSLSKNRRGTSLIPHTTMDWGEFKEFALRQDEGLIYRGQAKRWALKTSYHRTGHADLISYLDSKIPDVEHHVNSVSTHVYDAGNNDRSLGALLNLIQHHGYPTPLLDWTKSPYVAAFFAYENTARIRKDSNVSIFIFQEVEWSKGAGRNAQIRTPGLALRTMELPSYGNPRVMPQQSITMYANVDDIESLIRTNEKQPGEFLQAVAIPANERDTAMRDLSLMGLTWGSLFPDLDGICKQLASRHFLNR